MELNEFEKFFNMLIGYYIYFDEEIKTFIIPEIIEFEKLEFVSYSSSFGIL